VRKGGTKPDLASVDGFKRSLLTAKSIVYVDPSSGGASGIYIANLLERLGVAAEMKPKTKLSPPAAALYASVTASAIREAWSSTQKINCSA
jgi:molybdate transport system substrate-binding protein